MTINGLTFTVDNNGITVLGTPFGSTRPDLSPLLNSLPEDQRILLFSKSVFIPEQINSVTNPNLLLPVSFGNDKYVMIVNEEFYSPESDFKAEANKATWKADRTIHPSDRVSVWGAGNNYTGNNIVFEDVNFNDITNFVFDSDPVIKLKKDSAYSEQSVFLVLNKRLYSPGEHFSYDYNLNKITWLVQSSIPINPLQDKMFLFYFNRTNLQPFNLGQVLTRLVTSVDSNNQSEFELAALPKTDLNSASNVIYNTKKYSYSSDYTIVGNKLFPQNSGILKPLLTSGNLIDLSFFRDGSLYSPIVQSGQNTVAGTSQDVSNPNLYLTPIVASGTVNPANIRRLVFVNGGYLVSEIYTNGSLSSLYSGTDPEYYLTSSFIKINSTARVPNFIPLSSDNIEFVQFTDVLSQNHMNIEYFQRTPLGPNSLTLSKTVKLGKCFILYNGEALFKEFEEFEINSSNKAIIENIFYGVPNSSFDDIAIWYISDDAVANLFYFDSIIQTGDINWDENNSAISLAASEFSLTFNNPITNKNNTMLFRNGQKIKSDKYEIDPNNPRNLLFGVDSYFRSGDKIMLVHN